jgi:hypothetical protein
MCLRLCLRLRLRLQVSTPLCWSDRKPFQWFLPVELSQSCCHHCLWYWVVIVTETAETETKAGFACWRMISCHCEREQAEVGEGCFWQSMSLGQALPIPLFPMHKLHTRHPKYQGIWHDDRCDEMHEDEWIGWVNNQASQIFWFFLLWKKLQKADFSALRKWIRMSSVHAKKGRFNTCLIGTDLVSVPLLSMISNSNKQNNQTSTRLLAGSKRELQNTIAKSTLCEFVRQLVRFGCRWQHRDMFFPIRSQDPHLCVCWCLGTFPSERFQTFQTFPAMIKL